MHYTFIWYWSDLLYTLIFHTNFFIRYTLIFHTWFSIIYTYISNTWRFRFHAWCILHTLILSEKYCALDWSIYRLYRLISLNWLIYHSVISWLNWYIMQWWLRWLLGHTNTLWHHARAMIYCVLDADLGAFVKWCSHTDLCDLFSEWDADAFLCAVFTDGCVDAFLGLIVSDVRTDSFIWFLEDCCEVYSLGGFFMAMYYCYLEWFWLLFNWWLFWLCKRSINHTDSLHRNFFKSFFRFSLSKTTKRIILKWGDII